MSVFEIRITIDCNLFLYKTRKAPNGILIITDITRADIVTFNDRLIISIKSSLRVKIKLKAVSKMLLSIMF